MVLVTKEEFENWVLSQPDERPVRMIENQSGYSCGCLMVHYGKEVLKIEGKFTCGTNSWFSVYQEKPDGNFRHKLLAHFDNDGCGISEYSEGYLMLASNYKEAKTSILKCRES